MDNQYKTALITGAASGIGEASAKLFLDSGYKVIACGRNKQKLEKLSGNMKSEQLITVQADITKQSDRESLFEAVRKEGKLNTLVNNAGVIQSFGHIMEDVSAWQQVLDTNLVAVHELAQQCYPAMKHARDLGEDAAIINVSSVCGLRAHNMCSSTIYSVSKAGLDMLTSKLAQGLAEEGIRVNSVNPGVVETPMWGGEEDTMKSVAEEQHALQGRIIQPENVADAIHFLASEKAYMITGAILPVDAGYNLK